MFNWFFFIEFCCKLKRKSHWQWKIASRNLNFWITFLFFWDGSWWLSFALGLWFFGGGYYITVIWYMLISDRCWWFDVFRVYFWFRSLWDECNSCWIYILGLAIVNLKTGLMSLKMNSGLVVGQLPVSCRMFTDSYPMIWYNWLSFVHLYMNFSSATRQTWKGEP